MEALVIQSMGKTYWVKTPAGIITLPLKGSFKQYKTSTNPIAVGDKVQLRNTNHSTDNMIIGILPRRNVLQRTATHHRHLSHTLVANIDQVILLVSVASPYTPFFFIDSVLCACALAHIPVHILFNKWDLPAPNKEKQRQLYTSLAYSTSHLSLHTHLGTEQILALCTGKTSVLVGYSGSGKTSFIQFLQPHQTLKIQSVSSHTQQGKHTTSYTTMYHLHEDTQIIDTPGIKEFIPFNIDKKELSKGFVEFKSMRPCAFNNCRHQKEENCGIKEALSQNIISPIRYKNYRYLYEIFA